MKKIILLLALALLNTNNVFCQTTLSKSFLHNGIYREYRLYIPDAYSSAGPVPVIFNLHGYTSSNIAQEAYGDFREIADTAKFIIVHPNGTIDGSGNRYWNAYGFTTVDDLGFLAALIDTVATEYSVDMNRIYFTGMSNGGIMSYNLACNLSSRIAAIASVTGSMTQGMKNSCNALHPTPVMEIHGTADGTVPYNGSGILIPIDTVVKFWIDHNQCDNTPAFTSVPNINTTDGCTAERYIYSGGSQGAIVELFKVIEGGHTWPGATFNVGVTNMDFNASKEIWRFFRKYRLNSLTNISEEINNAIRLYPNPAKAIVTIEGTEIIRSVWMYDALGKELLVVAGNNLNKIQIITEFLEKGVYIIKIETSDKIKVLKFLKD